MGGGTGRGSAKKRGEEIGSLPRIEPEGAVGVKLRLSAGFIPK